MHVIASFALAVAALSSLGRSGSAHAPIVAAGTADLVLVAQVAPTCRPSQRYLPPVDAPITDPFRAPATPFGPGNRGLEYGTTPGQTIRAIGGGVVTFAGSIGGSRYVTVAHADGLRSSYSFLAEVSVAERDLVVAGQPVGRAGLRFHLGVRCADAYLDPASLVGTGRWRARLVPDSRFPSS
jgi:murein DD-endopeptidase MepM/ murein hydrolase activator NlpD